MPQTLQKTSAIPQKRFSVPADTDFSMADTVLMRFEDLLLKSPEKPKLNNHELKKPEKAAPNSQEPKSSAEPNFRDMYHYQMFISLEDEDFTGNSRVFFEIPITCYIGRKLAVNDEISFDFLALEEDAKKKRDKKTVKVLKKIWKKHHKVLSVKKYTIVGNWLPNIFFIRPLPPRKMIILGGLNKKSKGSL